jgi:sugar phosphate isomerase/epimerase
MKTKTGNLPIGFRSGRGEWFGEVDKLIEFALANDFEVLDVPNNVEDVEKASNAGLKVGTIDLKVWEELISSDQDKRKKAIDENTEFIELCANFGPQNFFVAMIPEDPQKNREENYDLMVESYRELAPIFEKYKSHLVIEGWPGPGALCCTPEGYRAILQDIDSPGVGINYDPSHLIRMGIDHIRFLQEFKDRVYHIHGKDTEILSENLYEYGNLQPPTFAKPFHCGEMMWRYTIPGHGVARWMQIIRILVDNGYQGAITIELEDSNFNDGPNSQQEGILAGARFLTDL